jgi:hypothetical protein
MSYRKNRDKEIHNLKKKGKTVSQIAIALWGKDYHLFFTDRTINK